MDIVMDVARAEFRIHRAHLLVRERGDQLFLMVGRQIGEDLAGDLLRQQAEDERVLLRRERHDEIGDVRRVQLDQRIAEALPILMRDCLPKLLVERERCGLGHLAKDYTRAIIRATKKCLPCDSIFSAITRFTRRAAF